MHMIRIQFFILRTRVKTFIYTFHISTEIRNEKTLPVYFVLLLVIPYLFTSYLSTASPFANLPGIRWHGNLYLTFL